MKKEPHQMRGTELRSMMEELEARLQTCESDRERQELHHRIDEINAELRRRSSIGRQDRSPSERDVLESVDHPGERHANHSVGTA